VLDEDGTIIGEYYADVCVETELIIEVKAAKSLLSEHEAQILGYLKSCRLKHGLLINFGSYKFEIRKFKWGMGLIRATSARTPFLASTPIGMHTNFL
jgi:PD-(D/E)XK nuclease superfamily